MKYLILSFFIGLGHMSSMTAQESLLTFSNDRSTFKKILKKSKENNRPVLAILYTTELPIDNTNSFANAKSLIEDAGYDIAVIDWTTTPKKFPQRLIVKKNNPTWVAIHPEQIILKTSFAITTNQELTSFLGASRNVYKTVDDALAKQQSSKDNADILHLAEAALATPDVPFITKTLDAYLKKINTDRISNSTYKRILKVAPYASLSKRLQNLLLKDRNRAIRLGDKKEILLVQQDYILEDLKNKGFLEPYYVWQRYENELGYEADSMYRRFALIYFSSIQPDKEVLYEEAFEFISFYPRSSWTFLDGLYKIVVKGTTKKEDLEEIYDLLIYQISRDESYRQLDYKAYVLYKLDRKKEALSLVQRVTQLALDEGVKYKSMIYSINKE